MSCYDALAPWYDSLTGDVPYGAIADYYESVFRSDGGTFRLLLDLCCGTGSMTWELAGRGYEMIAADRSVDMLMQAQAKKVPCAVPPLFLCQAAEELDLYGTVDAAVCCLDGFNYIPADTLPEVFRRLHLFILRYPHAGFSARAGRAGLRGRKGGCAVPVACRFR